jgi:hypothetical protein
VVHNGALIAKRLRESMSYVLAIEPREEEAGLLRHAIGTRTSAKLSVVDCMSAAITAIDVEVPHLVLVSALMPPPEEGRLLSRLRELPPHFAPQMLIMPALASRQTEPPRRGLFGRRRRRPEPARCDPSAFADQVSAYLDHMDQRARAITPPESVSPAPLPVTSMVVSNRRNESGSESSRDVPARVKSGAERRAAVRLEHIDWARVLVDGAAVDLIDLSATGAQVLAPVVLPPGERVQVLLSRETHAIRCEAGIVWGGFEIVGPGQAPWYRAGMNFRGADREAVERFYLGRD